MSDVAKPDLTTLTVQLLSAYVANNAVPNADLADLIRKTRSALSDEAAAPVEAEAPAEQEYTRAVSVKASLASPDHIISMIDGKPYKTLKRHLSTRGMTPAEYRERYRLPVDYPMVAPNYSERRRAVAVERGLGRKAGGAETATAEPKRRGKRAEKAGGAE